MAGPDSVDTDVEEAEPTEAILEPEKPEEEEEAEEEVKA